MTAARGAGTRGPGTLARLTYAGVLLALGFTLIVATALGQHRPARSEARHEVALVSAPDGARHVLPVEPVREPAPLTVTATVLPRQADAEATDDILAGLDAARADRSDDAEPAPAPDADVAGLLREAAGTSTGAPTAAARTALRFALAQVGRPYVWGATGPDSYDCSGLTWRAYATAGVGLPRVSRDQYAAGGTPVDTAALRPGDLVFFATAAWDPGVVHHVGMYVGRGLMVDAPHPGAFVRVEPVPAAAYVGAVRVSGTGPAPTELPPAGAAPTSGPPARSARPSPSPSPSSSSSTPSRGSRPRTTASPTPTPTTRWPTGPPRPSSWPHPSAPATTAPSGTPITSPTPTPTPTPTATPTPAPEASTTAPAAPADVPASTAPAGATPGG